MPGEKDLHPYQKFCVDFLEEKPQCALFLDCGLGKTIITLTAISHLLYVRFNMDGLMRGDYKSRMEGYAIGRQNGWMSANDIRELENMNPIPDADGGNEYLVNGNMIRIAQAAQNGGEQSGA